MTETENSHGHASKPCLITPAVMAEPYASMTLPIADAATPKVMAVKYGFIMAKAVRRLKPARGRG